MRTKNKQPGLVVCIVGLIILFALFPNAIWVIIFIIAWIVFIVRSVSKKSQLEGETGSNIASVAPEQLFQKHSSTVIIPTKISYNIPSPPPEVPQKARWIPSGESISIAGYIIAGGLLYVGTRLTDRYGQQDAAMINPEKPILEFRDLSCSIMGYWPSYSEISPQARGAYLLWLSTGRKDPTADVGYIFLFFYGLERRILVDSLKDGTVESEKPIIRAEVERLLNIYGGKSGSLQYYLSNFLDMLDSFTFGEKLYEKPIPTFGIKYQLPFYVKLAFGQAAANAVPISSHLALVWMMYDPRIIKQRTPLTRCSKEFFKLFMKKYQQHYGEGLKLSIKNKNLVFQYFPASSTLRNIEFGMRNFGNIPDVTDVVGPQIFQKIVNECADELDSFSRHLGRNTDKKEFIESSFLLPMSIWPDSLQLVLSAIKEQIAAGHVILTASELIKKFDVNAEVSKDVMIALAKTLESEQVGMEPDIISYPNTIKPNDSIVIYMLQAKIPKNRTNSKYQTAVLTLQLASAVANSDGNANVKEISFISEQLEKWHHLSEYHLTRLRAYLNLIIAKPIALSSIKKKMENIGIEDRKTIVSFVSNIALVDGSVLPNEVSFLEKVYKTFGVDVAELYSLLHNGVNPAEITRKSIKNGRASGITLNKEKIACLRKETENVSALLSGIFIEETEMPVDVENEENENILGLDDAHAAFLRMLMAKPIWNRRELVDIAKDLDLMIDGAIETINEASFTKYDQPAIEGDDPVEINMDIREEVLV